MNTHKRGRPCLPIEQRVAGRMLERIGPLKRIRWLLLVGGQTKSGLVRRAGFNCTRERARTIFRDLHLSIPRAHSVLWRIIRLGRKDRRWKRKTARAVESLARRFANQKWLGRQTKRFGSFEKLAKKEGFSSLRADRLREILISVGLKVPRKVPPLVQLRCGYCGRRFSRNASLHRRRLRLRKLPFAFCRQRHYYAFRKGRHR